jgi:hypothetical protein
MLRAPDHLPAFVLEGICPLFMRSIELRLQ